MFNQIYRISAHLYKRQNNTISSHDGSAIKTLMVQPMLFSNVIHDEQNASDTYACVQMLSTEKRFI